MRIFPAMVWPRLNAPAIKNRTVTALRRRLGTRPAARLPPTVTYVTAISLRIVLSGAAPTLGGFPPELSPAGKCSPGSFIARRHKRPAAACRALSHPQQLRQLRKYSPRSAAPRHGLRPSASTTVASSSYELTAPYLAHTKRSWSLNTMNECS
jgi:hypothetical protein